MITAAVGFLLLAFIGAPIVAITDKKRHQGWFLLGGVAGLILVVAYVVVVLTVDWTV
jgi:Na+/melibiose symporter-like transporter